MVKTLLTLLFISFLQTGQDMEVGGVDESGLQTEMIWPVKDHLPAPGHSCQRLSVSATIFEGDVELKSLHLDYFLERGAEQVWLVHRESLASGSYRVMASLLNCEEKVLQKWNHSFTVTTEGQPSARTHPSFKPTWSLPAHSLRILPPDNDHIQLYKIQVSSEALGRGIQTVRYLINGSQVGVSTEPPWLVELNLGGKPLMHRLEAQALDASSRVVATDSIRLNRGPHALSIRLIEPVSAHTYMERVSAQAVVDIPEFETLDRVEFFLNDKFKSA